jgi:hypothetical protein
MARVHFDPFLPDNGSSLHLTDQREPALLESRLKGLSPPTAVNRPPPPVRHAARFSGATDFTSKSDPSAATLARDGATASLAPEEVRKATMDEHFGRRPRSQTPHPSCTPAPEATQATEQVSSRGTWDSFGLEGYLDLDSQMNRGPSSSPFSPQGASKLSGSPTATEERRSEGATRGNSPPPPLVSHRTNSPVSSDAAHLPRQQTGHDGGSLRSAASAALEACLLWDPNAPVYGPFGIYRSCTLVENLPITPVAAGTSTSPIQSTMERLTMGHHIPGPTHTSPSPQRSARSTTSSSRPPLTRPRSALERKSKSQEKGASSTPDSKMSGKEHRLNVTKTASKVCTFTGLVHPVSGQPHGYGTLTTTVTSSIGPATASTRWDGQGPVLLIETMQTSATHWVHGVANGKGMQKKSLVVTTPSSGLVNLDDCRYSTSSEGEGTDDSQQGTCIHLSLISGVWKNGVCLEGATETVLKDDPNYLENMFSSTSKRSSSPRGAISTSTTPRQVSYPLSYADQQRTGGSPQRGSSRVAPDLSASPDPTVEHSRLLGEDRQPSTSPHRRTDAHESRGVSPRPTNPLALTHRAVESGQSPGPTHSSNQNGSTEPTARRTSSARGGRGASHRTLARPSTSRSRNDIRAAPSPYGVLPEDFDGSNPIRPKASGSQLRHPSEEVPTILRPFTLEDHDPNVASAWRSRLAKLGSQFHRGQRVHVLRDRRSLPAIVEYVGPLVELVTKKVRDSRTGEVVKVVSSQPGALVVGVQLESPLPGGHDGTGPNGIQYFKCCWGHGLLVDPHQLLPAQGRSPFT